VHWGDRPLTVEQSASTSSSVSTVTSSVIASVRRPIIKVDGKGRGREAR
jgi:hypothetical protein